MAKYNRGICALLSSYAGVLPSGAVILSHSAELWPDCHVILPHSAELVPDYPLD